MNIPSILFGLCIAMGLVVGYVMTMEEQPSPDVGHGAVHAQFATMQHGGDGAARHEPILAFGMIFGALICTFFVACLMLGTQKNGQNTPFIGPLALGGLLYVGVFLLMANSYGGYMHEEAHELVLNLPKPTAWYIYGIWGVPVVFTMIYVFGFNTWYITEEDIKRFHKIVADRHGEKSG